MLSIIIPAYNEEKRIGATLEKLLDFLKQSEFCDSFEVVVVNNGPDGTPEVVCSFSKRDERVRLVNFTRRLGKGGAVHEGFKAANGDCLIFDADSSMPPSEIPKLIGALKEFDIAIGSRHLPESKVVLPFRRKLASDAFSLLTRIVGGLPYADTQCGFKAFRHDVVLCLLPKLREKQFAWDVEVLRVAQALGLRVKEIPIEWHYVSEGTVTLPRAAQMLFDLVRIRVTKY
ncbi:TPA: glycosyltransferase family 2 protein [Candidatus Micrarchaeota archaeon]|nr:glycosyltransferase family 2 protein [Candidatus Micrarchaeota archaeon]